MTTGYFDLGDPAFDVTSPQVHAARESDWYVPTNYGFAVLRYAEVAAVLKDRRFRQGNALWPDQNGITSGPFHAWWQRVLLSIEGEEHLRLRRLLNPAFKQATISAMTPRFQALADELIDAFAERGAVEFIEEFAEPYAARIICLLLGFPETEWHQVARWADDLGKAFGVRIAEDLPRIESALAGLTGYCEAAVAERLAGLTVADGDDDFVTTLVRAHTESGRLSRRELANALVFLAFAGMETTRNQLGLALQTLLRHPAQWALLARRPELGRGAVEEVMRVNPTVTWITRQAIEDVDFQGLRIPAGTIVQALSHSAGTDPRVMSGDFDITAERLPHMGFGGGVHHCLGHWVARTDMSVALPLLARRLPDARPDGPGEWLPISGNTGALRFPITFTPTVRRLDR
jgi:cytochrome P450